MGERKNLTWADNPVFTGSISLGRWASSTTGEGSIAIGILNEASGAYSCAIGSETTASGAAIVALNMGATASGMYSCAINSNSKATGTSTFACGQSSEASGNGAFAAGRNCRASGSYSFAAGQGAVAGGGSMTALGEFNIISYTVGDKMIIGKGQNNDNRANCFRVTPTGVYASGNYNASGADYAEYFEWADGNPNNEDRIGLFVTLDGDKIKIATPEADYIIGVVSGNASVVGDSYDDQWNKMYLTDIFGRPIWETVEIPEEKDEEGNIIIPAHTVTREKLNPDYDNTKVYIKSSERPEWDIVGMMGKLIVIDDGSCEVNGWAAVGIGGIAVKSDIKTKYRVMSRIDENHIKILML